MITHEKFLEEAAKRKKYTFISTGMSTEEDIKVAVNIFRKHNCPFELMHTVSTYPMKDEHANLRLIETLRNKFSCNVGYSGHEVGLAVSYAASALGITSLERHITLDRAMYGSDQAASLQVNGLRNLVESIRKSEVVLGDGLKKIIPEEIEVAKKLRYWYQN